ncbi:MAG: transposase [Bacteroidota bacterium]|nr:transposase [Bacteroidota bacterium]
MSKYRKPLLEGKFYHVFNKGNNRENIFFEPGHYRLFIHKMGEFLPCCVDVYAYCLLPNHFHMLVRMKEKNEISEGSRLQQESKQMSIYSKAFQKFFTSYATIINLKTGRKGSLMRKPFKRLFIGDVDYLRNLVFYIHANPQMHGIIDDFRMYPWSTYNRIILGKPSKLKKQEVRTWFTNDRNYLDFHARKVDLVELRTKFLELE